jgi:ribonuclease-3
VELASLLGVKFKDESLLNQALVHRSAVYADKLESNQRLEYLGDAILGIVVAERLFESIPDADEGRLSEIRKRVINTRALAAAARACRGAGGLDSRGRLREQAGRARAGGLACGCC